MYCSKWLQIPFLQSCCVSGLEISDRQRNRVSERGNVYHSSPEKKMILERTYNRQKLFICAKGFLKNRQTNVHLMGELWTSFKTSGWRGEGVRNSLRPSHANPEERYWNSASGEREGQGNFLFWSFSLQPIGFHLSSIQQQSNNFQFHPVIRFHGETQCIGRRKCLLRYAERLYKMFFKFE